MTKEEAQKMCEIMTTADGDCIECAYYLIEKFIKAFPEFKELGKSVYVQKFDTPFEEEDG